jgi:hypothetical protein
MRFASRKTIAVVAAYISSEAKSRKLDALQPVSSDSDCKRRNRHILRSTESASV